MQKTMIAWTILIAVLGVSMAQETFSGSLVMVRCDQGDSYYLKKSPSEIDLSALQRSFNPRVDTLVFVHGFNNDFESAEDHFTGVVNSLRPSLGDRNYVGFHWPSDMAPDFGKGVSNANATGPHLAYVLSTIHKWYGGGTSRRIHVLVHSLGGRVLLSTLQQNEVRYVNWGYCFSLAAAVHKDAYLGSFAGTNLVPYRTLVYHSRNDWVLRDLYAMYYWLFKAPAPAPETGRSEGYLAWERMGWEERLNHLDALASAAERGEAPDDPFEISLCEALERADAEAMGLVGADLGNPVSVARVQNIDVSTVVDGHSYWDNPGIMQRIADVLR